MSLLMKALEKAAKDRVETRTEPAPASAAKAELSLEPLGAEAPGAPPRSEAAPKPAGPQRAPSGAAAREQAQAATVLQAGGRPADRGVSAYLRANPLWLLGGLAGLVALGFGIYVYLQIFHPGVLVRQPQTAPKGPLLPLAKAPTAPVAPAPALPLPATPLLQQGAPEVPPSAETPPARPKPPAEPAAPAPDLPRNTIVVSRGDPAPVLNPLLPQAYAALQANRLDEAQRHYQQLLVAEPINVDGLLGLAAIAALQGNSDEATRRYLRILELDPRHALAQSGLIALLGRADPLAAESKLRQLIAREPSAYLYFTLGNLYADQSLWASAQQAYFQAHHLEPTNPDYAYNLAVGLEHVSQPKLALGFYRRAIELGATSPTHFNLAQAKERISRLAAQVE